MSNQNDSVVLFNFCSLIFSLGLLITVIYLTQFQYSHKSKLADLEIEMNQREKLAELRSQAAAGAKYGDLVKNRFGFWEDKHGFIYDIEFNGDSGIDIVTWLGKLNPTEQQALQKEKQAKLAKIEYHKKELENLGVDIKKKNSGAVGIPMYDGGTVKKTVNSMKKILDSAENRKEKNGS